MAPLTGTMLLLSGECAEAPTAERLERTSRYKAKARARRCRTTPRRGLLAFMLFITSLRAEQISPKAACLARPPLETVEQRAAASKLYCQYSPMASALAVRSAQSPPHHSIARSHSHPHGLTAVESLERGDSQAKDTRAVSPSQDQTDAQFASRQRGSCCHEQAAACLRGISSSHAREMGRLFDRARASVLMSWCSLASRCGAGNGALTPARQRLFVVCDIASILRCGSAVPE